MILVFPIFPGRQKALWSSDSGRGILTARLDAALHVQGVEQVVVVTDDLEALEAIWPADDGRIHRIMRKENHDRETSCLLPMGTRAALEAVQELTARRDTPVMVADFRCPLVTGEDMSSALSEYAASDCSAMATVTAVRDNPCQLEGYYTVADVGVVHLFETGGMNEVVLEKAGLPHRLPSTSDRLVTRPFPFDWAAKGVAARGNGDGNTLVYRRSLVRDRAVVYLPYEVSEAGENPGNPPCLWIYESEQQARLVVSIPGSLRQRTPSLLPSGSELIGACVRSDGDSIPLRLFRLPDRKCCLYASRDMGNARLHLMPIGGDTADCSGSGVVEGFMEGGISFLFDCAGCSSGADAFAFWFLSEVGEQGSYDLCLDYPGEGVLWRTEKVSGRKLTLAKGEHMCGRQFFPDVYTPLSCLGILPADSYEAYDSEVAQGRCLGWVLPAERALRIASGFDMLVFRSLSGGSNRV